nr:EAL domain-containing protein [Microvirga makkahensis]
MDAALQARQKLEVELWDALAGQQFQVFYQPQFDLAGGMLIGVEALMRWRHPERGFVPPGEFIPVAEEIGLMDTLGEWVLHRACEEVARWPGTVKLAVNVSPAQFSRGDMTKIVAAALARSGLSAQRLELEITESLLIRENAPVQAIMSRLKTLGISFALDDFGTGYSSLSYLRKFPIDTIKIDRSFILGVPRDREAVAIVQAVIAMAASLDMGVVAEGLETQEQIDALRQLGCQRGQGYGLGRPQPAEELLGLLPPVRIADRSPGFPGARER